MVDGFCFGTKKILSCTALSLHNFVQPPQKPTKNVGRKGDSEKNVGNYDENEFYWLKLSNTELPVNEMSAEKS